jgi:hypothetical protein
MSLITDRTAPADVPTTDALASIPADVFDTPPAFYKLGISPAPIESPMALGDTALLLVRVRCTGEHGPLERKDGETRYERSLAIQWIGKPGEVPPTAEDDEQPALIATDGSIDPETVGQIAEQIVDRPGFSNLTGEFNA